MSNHLAHYNANGLTDGKIPAGQSCPFIAECTQKSETCPSKTALKTAPHSCPTARMHSLLKEKTNDEAAE